MAGVEPNSGKNPGNTIQCLSNSEGQAPNCSYCHKGRHFLTQCVEFLNGSLSDQPTSVRGVTHKMLKPTGWRFCPRGVPKTVPFGHSGRSHLRNTDLIWVQLSSAMMFFVSRGADLSFIIMEEKFL